MFTHRWLPAFACCLALSAWGQQGPDLGVEAAPAEVAAWDISIGPDGDELPEGSGNAIDGEPIYALQCLGCHGAEGAGLLNDVLVGGHGSLTGAAPLRTVGSFWPYATTIFDYIRRSMPYLQPHSLSDDEVYALTAYLLFLNGIIDEDDDINAQTLAEISMPNRDSFILAYPLRVP